MIKWKYILIFYGLALVIGLEIILLIPSPAMADFKGETLDIITFGLLAVVLIQKGVQLINRIKIRRHRS